MVYKSSRAVSSLTDVELKQLAEWEQQPVYRILVKLLDGVSIEEANNMSKITNKLVTDKASKEEVLLNIVRQAGIYEGARKFVSYPRIAVTEMQYRNAARLKKASTKKLN